MSRRSLAHVVALLPSYIVCLLSLFLIPVDKLSNFVSEFTSYLLVPFGGPPPYRVNKPNKNNPESLPAVVVTGSSTGIGRDVCLHLAKQGYVVFAGVRRVEDGQRLKDILSESSTSSKTADPDASSGKDQHRSKAPQAHVDTTNAAGRLIPILLDVTDSSQIEKAHKTVESTLKHISATTSKKCTLVGLVNNAGLPAFSPVEISTSADWLKVFNVNLFGVLNVTNKFLGLIKGSKAGRVVVISTAMTQVAIPGEAIYRGSKAAVECLTESLRVELQRQGVGVSIIQPGCIKTPIWRKLPQVTNSPKESFPDHLDVVDPFSSLHEMAIACAIHPKHVTDAVVHALRSPYPRRIYSVGWDAKAAWLLNRVIPGKILDTVVRWIF
ncbi:hypothetical protein BKA69DRAFT_1128830 [Paraphysoderma sedebokerense]|nr:hypothetical protein BKA69DRAFT_1128830 [Paraphysoderma sedebokerense]